MLTCPILFYFICRYQDKNTTALIMLKSSIRWLSFRGDLLSNLLVTSVSAGALFAMQSPGGYHQERLDVLSISLFRLVTRDALLHRAQLGWVHFGFNSMDCKQFSFPTETSDFFLSIWSHKPCQLSEQLHQNQVNDRI